ncbi:CubicO group peptidase (beta-lactamase class C family) [Leeuwenhoekiella aestuarii]|uniref:CubicO group peptidase (Beta-lactamase class C family) n=1 Tax=Leeuwenhoekiella aestuarii TaxID=2249426 RepID=A0A4Q0NUB2_9FLAO|nr:serine hydrolase [Leeuwenhoekiella aestuarii]RXG14191.1 CubicO group peptidase (beta-lactamase class C family) [Leeuwenhoekiella aestuarii]RXG18940.1 CubicO group peptidase (beta-lactamase class C family) [Leeuwenhoekiella aestuarii]
MKYFRLLLLSAISCCNCLSFEVAAQEVYFPSFGARWETYTNTDKVFSEESLQEAVAFALAHEYSGSRDLRQAILKGFEREPYHEILGPTKKRGGPAGMILKNGYLVTSWGDTQRVDMTFSVTKSFLSTTAGLAIDAGIIADVKDPVSHTIWDGTFEGDHNSKITWKHLLEQNSDWSGQLWGGKDWADRPPREGNIDAWKNRELQEPGTFFEYNDVRVNVLAYALTQTWRKPLPQVLKEQIMDPIGASTTWRWFGYDQAWTTIDGLHMQSVTGGGHSGGGMFISAEDMARFGLLFLNNGIWNGKRLLSENWVNAVQQPSAPNPNYGYMWWLNQPGPRHWKNLPEHLYYAAGFGGNFIVIDQENDLVIVLRWLEPGQIEAFLELVYGVK